MTVAHQYWIWIWMYNWQTP